MFCVFRIRMSEYKPGTGWIDDGYIYGVDRSAVERERQRRLTTCYHEAEKAEGSSAEIVIVHESFLRDLKITPVLSTIRGSHPADQGTLQNYKETIKPHGKNGLVATREQLSNANALSTVQ
jgi:hypothetical protein